MPIISVADAEAPLLSLGVGGRADGRGHQINRLYGIGTQHWRLESECVFKSIFQVRHTVTITTTPPLLPLCCYAVVSGRNRPLSENWIYNIELVNFYCNLEWMSVGRFFCLFFCTFPYVRPMTHIIYLLFATPTTMLHMVLRHATAHHTVRPLLWSRSWVAICFCQRPRQKIQAAVQCPH